MFRTPELHDDVTDYTRNGAHTRYRAAQRTRDRLRDAANDLRDEAAPVVDRLTGRASQAARQGADWVRDRGDLMRYQVARASDRTADYVRDEPMRSLLMAAGVGALVFALVRMLGSRQTR